MLRLIIIGSIPTADGYIFTAVMGHVLGMNMALQNSAFNAIVGLTSAFSQHRPQESGYDLVKWSSGSMSLAWSWPGLTAASLVIA